MKLITYPTLLLLMMTSSSCTTLSYYQQSISGHLEIIRKSKPIAQVLTENGIAPELRKNLQQAIAIRKYASAVLLLPDNSSYSSYVDLGRQHVLWNIVATPEFSLEPLSWCYLIVGCLTYRGYFSKAEAAIYAQGLKDVGYDVHIAGVTAYSTLGWFADPVINTMLQYDSAFLARVIFHELAHQLVYFADDTEFNEAFADMIAEYGVRRWLQDNNLTDDLAEFEQTLAREKEFDRLVFKYKAELEILYQSNQDADHMRRQKQAVFEKMIHDFEQSRSSWPGADDYKMWFNSGVNNAKLALVLTYKDLVPAFNEMLIWHGNDLRQFYQAVTRLADCDKTSRRQFLASNLLKYEC